jgi:hypothetical protein
MIPRALLLALAGCGWNHLPHGNDVFMEALWDPYTAVPTNDGLYVSLTEAGSLVLVGLDGGVKRIDLGEGRLTRLQAAPDAHTVLAFLERYRCALDDPKELRRVDSADECPAEALEVTTELALVAAGKVVSSQPVTGAYNQVAFTADGRFAIAYLDFSQEIPVEAVLNLTGVVVVDVQQGTSALVPVGFAVDRILFIEDEAGTATQAVVVSRNAVAVLDLQVSPAELTVTFPLTLDPDTVVDPIGIDLAPDGSHALISARGSSDLYVLDLEVHAINIKELAGEPGAMAVSAQADRTALVYPSQPVVEVLDHQLFEPEPIGLDEPMNQIELTGGEAVLWSNTDQHDVYRLDLQTGGLTEYRLQNPAVSMHLAPTGEFAVALTRPEGDFGGQDVDSLYNQHPGMEILDLRSDESEPFLLEGQGLGVAFASDAALLNALVLQQGVDYLYRLDLYTRQSEELELAAPPVAIGTMPDGRFFITHDRPLGLVSFLDPATGEVVEVGGFAAVGVNDVIELIEEER